VTETEKRAFESLLRAIGDSKYYVTAARDAAAIFAQRKDAKRAAFFHGAAYGAALAVSYLVDELGDLDEANAYMVLAIDILHSEVAIAELASMEPLVTTPFTRGGAG
jgi:hypothetical protein